MNENSLDEFIFLKLIGEVEKGDENSLIFLVVGILKEFQIILEEKERGINVFYEGDLSGNDLNLINVELEILEKSFVVEEILVFEIIEVSML